MEQISESSHQISEEQFRAEYQKSQEWAQMASADKDLLGVMMELINSSAASSEKPS